MLGRRPLIGKLSDLLVSGGRAGSPPSSFSDPVASPRSPLDLRVQSPRGPRGYDLGGVGLGIVAALERSGGASARRCVCGPGLSRAPATAAAAARKGCGAGLLGGGGGGGFEDVEVDCPDNYTYVTCHGPDKSFTKVYYDGGLDCPRQHERSCRGAVADDGVSRGPSSKIASEEEEGFPVFQALDFLSSCHLCGKNLHGRDIYMYRGEKAFCSAECRSRQMMTDERKEQKKQKEQKEQKCRNETSKAADLSSSPYTKGIFWTGIPAI
ncbi:hypothetical protein BT93_E0766 [Corymbia citriodora subsp. variegata]|nr:hypothetical protein BT93_E0766 [Corymbia citriodora subsp. variegata]